MDGEYVFIRKMRWRFFSARGEVFSMYFYCEKCKKQYPLNTHAIRCSCGGLFRLHPTCPFAHGGTPCGIMSNRSGMARQDRRRAGNAIVTRSPGAASSKRSDAPCSFATAATSAKPSPVPGVLRLRSSR